MTSFQSVEGWVNRFAQLRLAVRRYRNELPDRRPTEVESGIFVGGIPSRRRWDQMRACGVARVICLLAECKPDVWVAHSAETLWIPVSDGQSPDVAQLREACAFVEASKRAGSSVFIYCGSGMGRAPVTYLASCVRNSARPPRAHLDRLRNLRPCVALTEAQLLGLQRWAQLCGSGEMISWSGT